jgi:PAS domain S-box-containing protein
MSSNLAVTGVERILLADEIIVSKTDLKGRITYANDVFYRLSGLTPRQVIGSPHNIIRHPIMPRCVFKLLWETVAVGREIFAYVNNRAVNGDHYWVFAHVTASRDESGQIVGYHSSRRSVERRVVDGVIVPLYDQLRREEQRHASPKDGMAASMKTMTETLAGMGKSYDEFIFSL